MKLFVSLIVKLSMARLSRLEELFVRALYLSGNSFNEINSKIKRVRKSIKKLSVI